MLIGLTIIDTMKSTCLMSKKSPVVIITTMMSTIEQLHDELYKKVLDSFDLLPMKVNMIDQRQKDN